MSRIGLAAAIQAVVTTPNPGAIGAEALDRYPTAVVRVFGSVAGVAYSPDESECSRRSQSGSGALTELGVLDTLMDLPVGMPTSVRDLTERELRVVRRLPQAVVDFDGEQVVRRAVAPLSVRFALVRAREWREGLVKAGQFAPFCARAMLLPEPPADLGEASSQASFYGIGVGVFRKGSLQMLVEPAPYIRTRHSPGQWWFAEEVYRQVSGPGTGVAPGGSLSAIPEARPTPEPRPGV